jgi:tryptophan synthase beta chain
MTATTYGAYGGRYVPETLIPALDELERGWDEASSDPSFREELARLGTHYVGRPSPLYETHRFPPPGRRIVLKREDLNHTGAHKINNALGQILLATRLGKRRIVAETGAGQHGVATATVCARFGLECIVYMGSEDIRRQHPNVERMRLLGAEVRSVEFGTKTLKEATSEAIRDWIANVETTYYLIGSCVGPAPYPSIVRELQAVIGREARAQMLDIYDRLPDAVVACVGGGSNAIGLFAGFVDDAGVRLVGVERPALQASAPVGRPSCTARAPRCWRTTTARCSTRTRSRPASTIPASGPSTPRCGIRAGPCT